MKARQVAFALAFLCAPASAEEPPAWGHFSEAFHSGFTRVDVFETFGADDHWIFKRTKTARAEQIDWADSRTCPTLTESMNRLGEIETPLLATPANLDRLRKKGPDDGKLIVVNDPNVFELSYSGFYNKTGGAQATIDILADDASPLATWIGDTLKNVDACWKAQESK